MGARSRPRLAAMKIDMVLSADLDAVADEARQLHAMGFDGVYTQEANSDVTFPLLLAAQAAPIDIYTNVAIAFPRSPMHLAYAAFDLQRVAKGRFALGIGSQIRPHIEKRFSARFGNPVAHIAELVQALHAIFRCFHDGERLDFRGEYYTHTLMTPTFIPPRLAVRSAADMGWCSRPAHDPDGRRACRRGAHPSVQQRTVLAHGHAAARRGRPRRQWSRSRELHSGRRCHGVCLRRRSRTGRRREWLPIESRLLRIDAVVSRDPRRARLGRPAARAQPHDQGGSVGRDAPARSTTRCSTRCASAAPRPRRAEPCGSATRASPTGSRCRFPTASRPTTLAELVAAFRKP